jgi:hypothetical protein
MLLREVLRTMPRLNPAERVSTRGWKLHSLWDIHNEELHNSYEERSTSMMKWRIRWAGHASLT